MTIDILVYRRLDHFRIPPFVRRRRDVWKVALLRPGCERRYQVGTI